MICISSLVSIKASDVDYKLHEVSEDPSEDPSLCQTQGGVVELRLYLRVQQGELAGDTEVGRTDPLVSLQVFLQMIFTTEWLVAAGDVAGERLHPGVDPLVPGQLLVPGE